MTDRAATRTAELLRRLSDADVQAAARRLPRAQQRALGQALGVPASVLTDRPGSARVVRARTRGRRDADVADVAHRLVDATWNAVVDALGDHAEDPDEAQLRAAVDDVLPGHGAGACALVLALCSEGDFVAAPVAAAILDADARFAPDAVGPAITDEADASATPDDDTRADEAKRAERRARKDAEKASRSQRGNASGPARYKKAKRDTPAPPAPSPPAANSVPSTSRGAAAPSAPRTVRPVGAYPDLDLDDPLVGRLVLAPIEFDDDEDEVKVRPCVVLAASGPQHLVVRTCSSAGGAVSRSWKAVAVTDLALAGLDRPTFVSEEERRIARADVTATLGRLSPDAWNQL